jgi:hypothetical protein
MMTEGRNREATKRTTLARLAVRMAKWTMADIFDHIASATPSSSPAERATPAGMADLLAMCERISQLEAGEHGVLADRIAVVCYLDRLIESLLGCAARLRTLRNRYEAADDHRS